MGVICCTECARVQVSTEMLEREVNLSLTIAALAFRHSQSESQQRMGTMPMAAIVVCAD